MTYLWDALISLGVSVSVLAAAAFVVVKAAPRLMRKAMTAPARRKEPVGS